MLRQCSPAAAGAAAPLGPAYACWPPDALALSGAGLGVASPSIAASVANAVERDDLGIASAAQQLVTQVGAAAGIQVMETVQAARQHSAGLVGSFGDAYLVGAFACLLAVGCAFAMRRDPGSDDRPSSDELLVAPRSRAIR